MIFISCLIVYMQSIGDKVKVTVTEMVIHNYYCQYIISIYSVAYYAGLLYSHLEECKLKQFVRLGINDKQGRRREKQNTATKPENAVIDDNV